MYLLATYANPPSRSSRHWWKVRQSVREIPPPHDKSQTWFKAEIEELADVRSYKVKTEDGRILRRNRRHLCRSREPFYSSQPSEAPVALQPPDMAASPEKLQGPQPTEGESHSQQCQLGTTSLNSQPKPLLQYLARPNLCAQHLTSLSQLKIGSQELVGCQSHLAN